MPNWWMGTYKHGVPTWWQIVPHKRITPPSAHGNLHTPGALWYITRFHMCNHCENFRSDFCELSRVCAGTGRQTIGPKSACLESGGGGYWLTTAKFGLLFWRELMVSVRWYSDGVQLGEHSEGSELCQGVSITTWTMSPQNYFNSMLRERGGGVLEYMHLQEIVHWLKW